MGRKRYLISTYDTAIAHQCSRRGFTERRSFHPAALSGLSRASPASMTGRGALSPFVFFGACALVAADLPSLRAPGQRHPPSMPQEITWLYANSLQQGAVRVKSRKGQSNLVASLRFAQRLAQAPCAVSYSAIADPHPHLPSLPTPICMTHGGSRSRIF